jgi:hypothetical protein
LLHALAGLRVTVAGSDAWRDLLPQGANFVGQVDYHQISAWTQRSKVCVALNPTQFVHGFSERLLLSLAGGAATITDDRLWVRECFTSRSIAAAVGFSANAPQQLRANIEQLLADNETRRAYAVRGRALVEAQHLWVHRLPVLLKMAGFANSAPMPAAAQWPAAAQ